MKKVIGMKMYNTETANELVSYSNFGSWRDFRHVEETLYRKKTGEYFLHGKGGPASEYAEKDGVNSWSGGERIVPYTEEEAREWVEEHFDGDVYEDIFGEVEE